MTFYESYREVMEATAHANGWVSTETGAALLPPASREPTKPKAPERLWVPPRPHTFIGMYYVPLTQRVTVAQIQETVARRFNAPLSEMRGESVRREHAHPRQVAMYLAKLLTSNSYVEIGRRFGGRDHTTVIYAIRQVERRRLAYPELDRTIRQIVGALS